MKSFKAVLVAAVACASGAAFAAGSTVSGSVSFSGTPPTMEPLKRNSDPVCAKTQANDESVVVKDGKLQNVVIRIKDAPAGAVPTQPVTVDQTQCMYRPRVSVAVEGQEVKFLNSDNTLHNVHGYAGPKTVFNQAQPPKSAPIDKKDMKPAGDVLKLKCDVHPWMTGYVVFSKNPYSAVSGADGTFQIKDVPPGTYTVEAWHEKLGTQTSQLKVEAGKPAKVSFTFAAK